MLEQSNVWTEWDPLKKNLFATCHLISLSLQLSIPRAFRQLPPTQGTDGEA